VSPRLPILRALWRILTGSPIGRSPLPIAPAHLRPRIAPVLDEFCDSIAAEFVYRWYKHRDDAPDEATLSEMRDFLADKIHDGICERFVWDDGEGP
jgi:hypothetical protein